MNILYGKELCNGIKSNNYKKMHGIPMKAKGATIFGGEIVTLSPRYVSSRSKKKQNKARFRGSFNMMKELEHQDKPMEKRIWHRYGYMPKVYRKKLRRNHILCKNNDL